MSPNGLFNSGVAFVFAVNNLGLIKNNRLSESFAIRPAVSLVSGVKITTDSQTNPGTASNPYRVVES